MNPDKYLPTIQKNVFLAKYTTFKIGGKAKYFFIAKTKKDLIKAISFAKKTKLSFFNSRVKRGNQSSRRAKRGGVFILGGGSNLLISDKGYKGLVIKIQMDSIFSVETRNIYAEAGARLADLVKMSLEKRLTGLEWAAGIPGATIGGAIYGNAGAFGESMKNVVENVEVLDCRNLKIKSLKNKNCKFGYRESIFKRNKNLIILSATFKLKKDKKEKIKKLIEKYLNHRRTVQPLNYPSAGSVFRNPTKNKELTAGKLIEKCGLKGKIIGRAKISEKHANFIVNLGGAKAKDVKKLINLIKKQVKNKFGITLKEEIRFL
jgi:UDP-N-acetylmuramate dehydrogenase